jgi:hypothetical protein
LPISSRAVIHDNGSFTNVSAVIHGESYDSTEMLALSDSGFILVRDSSTFGPGIRDYLLNSLFLRTHEALQ